MRCLFIVITLLTLVVLSTSRGNDDPFKRDLFPRATSTDDSQPTAGEGSAIVGNETPESTSQQPSETASATDDSSATGSASITGTSQGSSTTGKAESSDTKSGDDKKTTSSAKSSDKSSKKSSTKIPSTAQVGSVSMLTPAATDGYTMYKIGEPVTFVWNYTGVVITPTAVNVAAYCTEGANTFTIAGNASAGITSVVWDTGEYESTATVKLPVATYSLYIWDASKARTDVASAGYLSGDIALTFGMYTPESYVPLSEFHCATCNPNAAASLGRNFLIIVGMGVLAALSGTWFMAGLA